MTKPANFVMLLGLTLPLAAAAQYDRSRVRIEPPVYSQPSYTVPYSSVVRSCMERQDTLEDRKSYLDHEKHNVDREADAIAREGTRLADQLRRLPSTDVAAVAAYNERSEQHNRRVAEHNQRVADMNAAASSLNNDSADMMSYCSFRYGR